MSYVMSSPDEWDSRMLCAEEPVGVRGRFALADSDDEIRECLEVCRECPSLPVCELWGWERRRNLAGVVGGVFYRPAGAGEGDNRRRGLRRDLFWLEGKRASDLGKCEWCGCACSGRCDRIRAFRLEAGLDPDAMEGRVGNKPREKDRIRDGENGKEYLCYACERWQSAEFMIKNKLTACGLAARCKECAAAARRKKYAEQQGFAGRVGTGQVRGRKAAVGATKI